MADLVPVNKDPDGEHPVPTVWRKTLSLIVEALVEGDFSLSRGIPDVMDVDAKTAKAIPASISDYGNVHLTKLPEETWNTSVCQWMWTHWEVMVDLYTVEEGASDLVLSVTVREVGDKYKFEIYMVYVP